MQKLLNRLPLSFIAFFVLVLFPKNAQANLIHANPSNYTGFLSTLVPGDTLSLDAGVYIKNLKLVGLNGTAVQPIVVMGAGTTTEFQGQACCNTVSITQCSYLTVKNMLLDGQNEAIDAVKAEGTTGNWSHHITIEYLRIINYGSDQQNVGISTKSAAWDWVIRKNTIIGAGTGLYLGNSDGTDPFVNGVIEYNYVANTVGYCMEIKHQFNGTRDEFPGTAVNGKTIIRHNVFTKDQSSSTGGNARPNLLVGGFPTTGWGSTDYYEIYDNFFYNNPVEALFQGTGNITMYNNIFVNHFEPGGVRAVYFTPQNGVNPQDIKVFHNTVWAVNSAGGIRILNPNAAFQQYCYANAVFAPSAITNFTNSVDNITDTYTNASNYVLAATTDINTLNLYPKTGQLTGTLTPNNLFQTNTLWDQDFNGDTYNWTFRGAYSGCCNNPGWKLQLDTMASPAIVSGLLNVPDEMEIELFPNPVSSQLTIIQHLSSPSLIEVYAVSGAQVFSGNLNGGQAKIDVSSWPSGVYFLRISNKRGVISRKILKK